MSEKVYRVVCAMDGRFGLRGDCVLWRECVMLKNWRIVSVCTCEFVQGSELREKCFRYEILVSIVVSIPACHAGDPGSIPGRGVPFSPFPLPDVPCLLISFQLFLLANYGPPIHPNCPPDPPPSKVQSCIIPSHMFTRSDWYHNKIDYPRRNKIPPQ